MPTLAFGQSKAQQTWALDHNENKLYFRWPRGPSGKPQKKDIKMARPQNNKKIYMLIFRAESICRVYLHKNFSFICFLQNKKYIFKKTIFT